MTYLLHGRIKDAIPWVREHERNQANMSKWTLLNFFYNILPTLMEYLKNIFWHLGYSIWWREGTFCHVFMDENVDKRKRMNLFYECWQHFIFCKKLNIRNKVEFFYVGLFWKFRHMKCSSHTSTSISYFINMKYIPTM